MQMMATSGHVVCNLQDEASHIPPSLSHPFEPGEKSFSGKSVQIQLHDVMHTIVLYPNPLGCIFNVTSQRLPERSLTNMREQISCV